ncbi:MAG: hypothetical protein KAI39_10840 [Desulfobulbaceae bacterium]|nr:hypothetical protein [Desulfobulbaceae bacterium]
MRGRVTEENKKIGFSGAMCLKIRWIEQEGQVYIFDLPTSIVVEATSTETTTNSAM